jgi:hypothetical protein
MQEFIEAEGRGLGSEHIPIRKTMTHTEMSRLMQSQQHSDGTL